MQAVTLTAINSQIRVLIADDDVETRSVIAAMVRRLHYACDEAADGHSACQMLQHSRYALILSDINMPGNCSLELVDAANKLAPGVPIILITAVASRETAMNAVGTQVSAYLEKPVSVERLHAVIEKSLRESQEERAQHGELLNEVVTVLAETRQNFKSKRLGELRKKVETAISKPVHTRRRGATE